MLRTALKMVDTTGLCSGRLLSLRLHSVRRFWLKLLDPELIPFSNFRSSNNSGFSGIWKHASPDVRSRERAWTCLHRVSCHVSVGLSFFSVRGAVWRRVCGRSPPPCPNCATTTSALTAHFAHLPVRTCRGGPVPFGTILLPFREFASAECVSLSSRVTRGESSPASG